MRKSFFFLILGLGLIFLGTGLAQEDQIEKAKIFQEDYPLITESDLYCSIYILDGASPRHQDHRGGEAGREDPPQRRG